MRYQLRAGLMIPAVAGLAILAGCGSPATAAATGVAEPAAAPAPSQDAPVATNAVSIENFVFSPATVTIKAGTTITWTNRDQDAHTVTAMSGGAFHCCCCSPPRSCRGWPPPGSPPARWAASPRPAQSGSSGSSNMACNRLHKP
jgi:plastocyanin